MFQLGNGSHSVASHTKCEKETERRIAKKKKKIGELLIQIRL